MTKTQTNLRIAEAMQHASDTGSKVTKIELARAIWPDRKPNGCYEALDRLISGKAVFVPISGVVEICRMTGVDANFLFGIDTSITISVRDIEGGKVVHESNKQARL